VTGLIYVVYREGGAGGVTGAGAGAGAGAGGTVVLAYG